MLEWCVWIEHGAWHDKGKNPWHGDAIIISTIIGNCVRDN